MKIMNEANILRSNTGVYHVGSFDNGANCNDRPSGKFSPARQQDVEKASAKSFCKKCFYFDTEGNLWASHH